jgi:hypothetical protein
MSKSIPATRKKRGRGRPRVGSTQVNVKIPPPQLRALDDWIAKQADKPLRTIAIRRLLKHALAHPPKNKR